MAGELGAPVHLPSEVAELPEGWRWLRLDHACGSQIFDCPHSTPVVTEDGPLMVRTQDILGGVFRAEQAAHVSEDTYTDRVRRVEPQHGDLFYSREGTYFGIAAEVPNGVRVCLGQRMVLLRPEPSTVDSRFLRFWLNSPVMSRYIHGFRDGTVAERLNLPTIRALPVLLPPPAEQRAIANILGTLDDKIELNRRMNETLEGMARAIFKSWFVDFDPVRAKAVGRQPAGMDPATAALFPDSFEDSPLGKIPKGWKVGTVDDHFRLTMGQSPPGSTYNETGEGVEFYQGRTDFGFRYPAPRVYCTAPTRFAEPGDTLVSVRAPVGSVNMASRRCAVGRGVAAIRHKSGSRSFTYYAMQNLEPEFLRFEAEGTVFGSIGKADFHRLQFVEPEVGVAAAFERLAHPLDERISLNERESLTLSTCRDTVLPRVLSGDLPVP